MRMSYAGLVEVLQNSVVEVAFVRRIPKLGYTPSRRMLCTNNQQLLNNIESKIALRYRSPMKALPYNANSKGLITVWDIMWCDWRHISTESHDIISVMPVRTEEETQKFWVYFDQFLSKLDPQTRANYGNI
jgi:hypothetical protein